MSHFFITTNIYNILKLILILFSVQPLITYGTSEFYTKPYQPGAASPIFKHIGLDKIITMVESALELSLQRMNEYKEWLSLMRIEQNKRKESVTLLQ